MYPKSVVETDDNTQQLTVSGLQLSSGFQVMMWKLTIAVTEFSEYKMSTVIRMESRMDKDILTAVANHKIWDNELFVAFLVPRLNIFDK